MKKALTYIVLTLELVAEVILLISMIGASMDQYVEIDALVVIMIGMVLLWLVITVAGFFRVGYGKKFVILPGLGMIAAVGVLALAGYMIDGMETGIFPVAMLILLTVFGIRMMRKQKAKEEQKSSGNSQGNSLLKYDRYKAEWAWDDAAKEFCETFCMSEDDLTDKERDQIYVYACGYIAYLFAWIVKRDFVGPQLVETAGLEELYKIKQEKTDPAEWLYYHMDGTLDRDDISVRILKFIDDYYLESPYSNGSFKRSIWYGADYREVVLASGSMVWCREFSWETYRRMEERLDLRYHYYKVWDEFTDFDSEEESDRKMFSESLGQELEVVVASGVSEEYVKRCEEHCKYLSAAILGQICKEIEEVWNYTGDMDGYTPERFKQEIGAGSLVIPKPYGEDIAYILCFETDFEEEHGISIMIRQDTVLGIGYRMDVETPWDYENEQTYRKKLQEKM